MNHSLERLAVFLENGSTRMKVGVLAYRQRQALLEYEHAFLRTGLELSPFYLPLKADVLFGDRSLFQGLFGVFEDSLPDGWGRLLIDRKLRKQGREPSGLTPLDRLSMTGSNGMGALTYEPDMSMIDGERDICLDTVTREIDEVLHGHSGDIIDHLIGLNGSSAGARPKIMVGVSQDRSQLIHGGLNVPETYEAWIIKFRSSHDSKDIGRIEYAYGLMAQHAGITMSDIHLFVTQRDQAYFGTKRFDREKSKRIHMHSLSGLLHADFRIPSLDYKDVLKATFILTRDLREVEKMFRIAVFNILCMNRDDHPKNFSFLMDDQGVWRVAPGYDLTYSTGPGGEHATTVLGEGRSISVNKLKELGINAGIAGSVVLQIVEGVMESQALWPRWAEEAGLSTQSRKYVQKEMMERMGR